MDITGLDFSTYQTLRTERAKASKRAKYASMGPEARRAMLQLIYAKRRANPEGVAAARRRYRDSNLERVRMMEKASALRRKDKRSEYSKKYFRLPEVKIRAVERARVRRNTDISFKLGIQMRKIVREFIMGRRTSARAQQLLGCNLTDARAHLESLFKPGMSWDNYGPNGWTIDHVKPCSYFNLSNEAELLECFNIKNTQPLWRLENISKGDSLQWQQV